MAKKLLIIAVFTVLAGLFYAFDLGQYLTLDYIKSQQESLQAYYQAHPLQTLGIYFIAYVIITGVSLPGAAVMTLAGGAIFGTLTGLVLVSFASTIGATIAFLASRYILRDSVQNKFRDKLKTINEGIEKEGAFYLFTLRLVPIFPFFLINLLMGLMPIRVITFFFVSQIGMLPGTWVYVNAGTQLAKIESLSGILSPALIASFVLLGLFPLIAKKLVSFIQSRRVLKNHPKPQSFDRNLVVIGAGSAGLVSAYIAAAVKSKVTLIERHKMGGDCLNTGCVPSKALIRSASFYQQTKRAHELGFKAASAEFDFADIMDRVHRVIRTVEPHDSIERYTGLGVDVIEGEAQITSPYHVQVNGRTLSTRNIIIATGARPFVPPIPGLEKIDYLTSDTVWGLRALPQRLIVIGGGPIGCELAQCFARFGSRVSIVQQQPRLMMREDPEVSDTVQQRFERENIRVLTKHQAKSFEVRGTEKVLVCECEGNTVDIPFDNVLLAVGRAANTQGFGAEELGIEINDRKTIKTNAFLQTNYPNIYACGDVAGPYQFTHTASHQAWYASVNALFGMFKKFKADYSVIPWSTFTDPEVARVGLNELEAKEREVPYEVTTYGIDDLDRAIADEEAHGFIKVLTVPGKDKILGVTLVGAHAGDLIAEYVSAMKHGIGLNKILGTIHIYPTMAEANKYVAGEWKRAHAPEGLLRWVEKFHHWRLAK
ncbi:MAG TPA: pyridine nucleotide-disulfide oxidoreductase [Gammaproteobacteria bacterium]|nr:pyridine nucleotide-disulfide oxidoreductase [Gammaproteobacteria bacterium]